MTTAPISQEAIYIVGAGAQTPVGRHVLAAAAAVRGGISRYGEHPFMLDRHGEPMIVARATWLAETLAPVERLARLAADAARAALQPLLQHPERGELRMQVKLALDAETLPQAAEHERVLDGVTAEIGPMASDLVCELVLAGHAGGLLALDRAAQELKAGRADLVLLGGADSLLSPQRLEAVQQAGRLHSPAWSWGFTPGEGAGFCLLSSGAVAARLNLLPLAEVVAVCTATESRVLGSQPVCIGEGLSAAFRGVLSPELLVAHSYCDLNGEPYRADEFGFTICRTRECFADPGSFTAAAECWGDVGASSAPLALGLAVAAWARGHAKGPLSLVWNSSANLPLRGAALLRETPGPRR